MWVRPIRPPCDPLQSLIRTAKPHCAPPAPSSYGNGLPSDTAAPSRHRHSMNPRSSPPPLHNSSPYAQLSEGIDASVGFHVLRLGLAPFPLPPPPIPRSRALSLSFLLRSPPRFAAFPHSLHLAALDHLGTPHCVPLRFISHFFSLPAPHLVPCIADTLCRSPLAPPCQPCNCRQSHSLSLPLHVALCFSRYHSAATARAPFIALPMMLLLRPPSTYYAPAVVRAPSLIPCCPL